MDLKLATLLRGMQRRLWIALGVAAALHGLLSQVDSFREREATTKPLTIQFIKRQPRLAKPLEMKKHPKPKRRTMRREMVALKARVDRQQMSARISAPKMLQSLARPSSLVARSTYSSSVVVEPSSLAQSVTSAREAKNTIDTSLEMLSVQALDTGQHHAMVIQDPRDKRNVRGYFHLHPVYSVSMRERGWHDMDSRTLRALVHLAAFMNERTDIKVDIAPAISLDSSDLFKTPWAYATAHSETKGFQITSSESANLGRYLTSGGFVFTETVSRSGDRVIGTAWEIALRQMLKDALGSQGRVYQRDWVFEPLPDTHPIYRCFFDFNGAPPGIGIGMQRGIVPDYLEGITLGNRLVAIVSLKRYFYLWNNDARASLGLDPTRPLQFGVNVLVFVLTQEGSITQQVMHSVD
jgi:hypothetical protein